MESDELRRSIEFLIEHQGIRIETASDLERWKEIAPSSLHELFERMLAFRSMSFREKIDCLTASNERLREEAKELETINAQNGGMSGECDDEELAGLIERGKRADELLKALRKKYPRRSTNTDAQENDQ